MKLSAEQIQEFEQWQAQQAPQPGDDKLSWWERSYRDMQIWLRVRQEQAQVRTQEAQQEAIRKAQEQNKQLFDIHASVMADFHLTHPEAAEERTQTAYDLISAEIARCKQ